MFRKIKEKIKKSKAYKRFRKDLKAFSSFDKLCIAYEIHRESWLYNVIYALSQKGFDFVPKNGIEFSKEDDEVLCIGTFNNFIENLEEVQNTIKFSFNLSLIYPWIAYEIFVDKIYKLPKSVNFLLFKNNQKYAVLDIGANRGYASLYFAMQEWCEKIFAFELFPQICQAARANFSLNPALATKINLYEYGLGNKENIDNSKSNGGGI